MQLNHTLYYFSHVLLLFENHNIFFAIKKYIFNILAFQGENDFDNQYSDCAQYGRIQFWDDRYAKETEPFEWYYGYEYFRETIQEYVKKDAKVMVAGCGSSNMLIEMAEDGYQDIVGADISRVVIHQQKTRCRGLPAISFFQVSKDGQYL